jgi:hypothetical protein
MIRLVMIVRDESAIITRCLKSVFPYVNDFTIMDTGSADDTIVKITECAEHMKMSGMVFFRPWVDFATNRSEALRLARQQLPAPEYLLTLDADDIFHGPPNGGKLTFAGDKDAWLIKCVMNDNLVFYRLQMFSAKREWLYKGVVHEYAAVADGLPQQRGNLDECGCWLNVRTEGYRSRNPKKYETDALLLDGELERGVDDAERHQFYAAQSWRDAGNIAFALSRYIKRASMAGGYREEQYVALLNAIRFTDSFPDALKYAWRSIDVNRNRREAVTAMFRRAREHAHSTWTQELFAIGLATDTLASKVVTPEFLFAETEAYTWSFDDEFSVICFFLGHKHVSLKHAAAAYQSCPASERARVKGNVLAATHME